MRNPLMPLLALGLSACGIKQYLPERPALSEGSYEREFAELRGADVVYTGLPRVEVPVLPLQVWGVAYDLDLVIVSTHPDYQMHEYARIQTPDGPLWLAKDALAPSRRQSIVADLPDLEALMPELPVPRSSSAVRVEDRSDDRWLDLDLAYTSLRGEQFEVHYEGRVPHTRQGKRNGSTMGHSSDIVMAALDLPLRDYARKALVTVDGVPYRTDRLLGIKPFEMALVQTQGGLAVGEFRIDGGEESFQTHYRVRSGATVPLTWTVSRESERVLATQEQPLRSLEYTFLEREGALELSQMTARQWGRGEPTTHVAIQPALPDLRRPFEGRARSRFVVDINGQPGHAVGTLEAWWEGDRVFLAATPEAPWWFADRPMLTTVSFDGAAAQVSITRVGMK